MAATVSGILLSGTHAARPAASSPPTGSVYSCSDHALIYVTNGSAWSTWATLGTAGGITSLASAKYKRTAGDYSTTSNTFVDVDATNLALSITTGARRVLVVLTAAGFNTSAADYVMLDVDLDGSRMVGGTNGLIFESANASEPVNCSFSIISDVLTAASHTFKLQFRRASAGTVTLYGGTSSLTNLVFAVHELPS